MFQVISQLWHIEISRLIMFYIIAKFQEILSTGTWLKSQIWPRWSESCSAIIWQKSGNFDLKYFWSASDPLISIWSYHCHGSRLSRGPALQFSNNTFTFVASLSLSYRTAYLYCYHYIVTPSWSIVLLCYCDHGKCGH